MNTLLKEKLDVNLAEYKSRWLQMTPAELIEICEEIAAVTRMAKVLPAFATDSDAEYLLKFKNPLEVVADAWKDRNGIDEIDDSEISNMLWSLRDKSDAYEIYELEAAI